LIEEENDMLEPKDRPEKIHLAVQTIYGEVAKTRQSGAAAACCAPASTSSDYTPEELASVPEGAYLGEGSGAPVRFANLRRGDVVVDLGAGAGMDSFLAANRIGPEGHVHGFDLTPEMLERARKNAAAGGYSNVTFERGDIAHLPLDDASSNVAISNCVINLTPDKNAVYRELARVLKPGGRIAIADIVLRGPDAEIRALHERANAMNWCACVAGALEQQEYIQAIRDAGFEDLNIASERPAMSQPGGGVEAVAITLTARKPA
jgi:arsenite methyltransferase